MRATTVTGVITSFGEGPVWDADTGRLYLVDLLDGDILGWSPVDGVVSRTHVGPVVSALRPTVDGGLVFASGRRFGFLPAGASEPVLLPELWEDSNVRMNDGGCDPQGRFYAGSMAYDETPAAGRVWRLDHDGRAHPVLDGVTISNGLVWSLDGQTVYYVDTATQRIDAFDFDAGAGQFHDRRTVVTIPESSGSPDGLTIDADGRLWVALWNGFAVHCYDVDGALQEIVEVPAKHVTACAFGGPGLDELFITTARRNPEPEAGAVFHAKPGVRGVPLPRFTGTPR